jgi:hypothetical protein
VTESRKVTYPPEMVVPIVADGAIAGHGFADGRLLPLLILDTSTRRDVAELLRVHEFLPVGDQRFQWARSRDTDDDVALYLRFIQPMDVELLLRFSVERQAILVEGILSGGGVWLQAGKPGDRLATTMDANRVAIELPDTGFRPEWERFLLKRMTRVMSRRLGVSHRSARPAARKVITDMQAVARFRMSAGRAGNNADP